MAPASKRLRANPPQKNIEQYAYLIDRLSKMQEGERSVLDNSCIMFVSEHWNAHNGNKVPLVLAGGLGGTLQTGRSWDSLNYEKAGNDKRKLCSLYLAIMDRMGLRLPEFGDARAPRGNLICAVSRQA